MAAPQNTCKIDLENKPDFHEALQRIQNWFAGRPTGRPLINFYNFNEEHHVPGAESFTPADWKAYWFDSESVVARFEKGLEGKTFLAETFPTFFPNLGPSVYAAFYGCPLEYEETTSWSRHCLPSLDNFSHLRFDPHNEYFQKIEELTRCALDRCKGKFLVGYTDLHPGLDCVADWRGSESLCMDLYDTPEKVKQLIALASRDFQTIYDHFDSMLKAENQLSVTWMGVPTPGKMHIPSCDFSAMISPDQFDEFYLPQLQAEVKPMTDLVFHVDGPGVAKHLDRILAVPQIQAIQWVQGVGPNQPILPWLPLIKRIQNAGKGVQVFLKKEELDDFIPHLPPDRLYLCIPENDINIQKSIIARISRW